VGWFSDLMARDFGRWLHGVFGWHSDMHTMLYGVIEREQAEDSPGTDNQQTDHGGKLAYQGGD
jgi:hypothetical protein